MSKRRKSQVFSDDSDEDSNEEVLPAFLDHARNHYTDELPPFIQERLSPGISPGDQREVLARTKSGNFPSSSTSRAKETLTCRAWDNLGNRFWTTATSSKLLLPKQPQKFLSTPGKVWIDLLEGLESRLTKTTQFILVPIE